MTRAVVVVDVQHDFIEGGAIPVEHGTLVAGRIAEYLDREEFDLIAATRDWHPHDAPFHFAPQGTEPDYAENWPVHCVEATHGALIPRDLRETLDRRGAVLLYKGQREPGYSGFDAVTGPDGTGDSLATLLRAHGVDELVLCGIATDVCVAATARDAVAWAAERPSRHVTLRADLTAAVDLDAGASTLAELAGKGVKVVGSLPGN